MTNIEHMVAWIESSRAHYDRLLDLERIRKGSFAECNKAYCATFALGIVTSAFREATLGGDMFAEQWDASALLDAAKALLEWEMEQ